MAGRLGKLAKLQQEMDVWDLLTKKHLPPAEIARRLSITPKRVNAIIEQRTNEMLSDMRQNAKRYLVQQVHKYDWITEEATEAWHRSKSNRVRVKKKIEPRMGSDGKVYELEKREEQHDINTVGDVRFLDAIVNATVEQAKLLKLYDLTDEELEANKVEFSVDEIRKRLQTVLPNITVVRQQFPQLTVEEDKDDDTLEGEFTVSDSANDLSQMRSRMEDID